MHVASNPTKLVCQSQYFQICNRNHQTKTKKSSPIFSRLTLIFSPFLFLCLLLLDSNYSIQNGPFGHFISKAGPQIRNFILSTPLCYVSPLPMGVKNAISFYEHVFSFSLERYIKSVRRLNCPAPRIDKDGLTGQNGVLK